MEPVRSKTKPKLTLDNKKIPESTEDKTQGIKFLTCEYFPKQWENYQIWFGATVSARSIKLINEKTTERDTWW
jgi:hypothetical protein